MNDYHELSNDLIRTSQTKCNFDEVEDGQDDEIEVDEEDDLLIPKRLCSNGEDRLDNVATTMPGPPLDKDKIAEKQATIENIIQTFE